MRTTGYTALGWIVWRLGTRAARRKLRQNRGRLIAAAAVVGVLLAGLAIARAEAGDS